MNKTGLKIKRLDFYQKMSNPTSGRNISKKQVSRSPTNSRFAIKDSYRKKNPVLTSGMINIETGFSKRSMQSDEDQIANE